MSIRRSLFSSNPRQHSVREVRSCFDVSRSLQSWLVQGERNVDSLGLSFGWDLIYVVSVHWVVRLETFCRPKVPFHLISVPTWSHQGGIEFCNVRVVLDVDKDSWGSFFSLSWSSEVPVGLLTGRRGLQICYNQSEETPWEKGPGTGSTEKIRN